jgi:K+-transporting ATPase ATPase A chain
MTFNGLIQIGLFLLVLLALVKPLGWYMAQVYEGKPLWINRILGPVERALYRMCGINETEEMNWKTYGQAMLMFSAAGMLALYSLQRLQGFLPLNPQGFGSVASDLSFNTAVSYLTNTNWQAYAGETTMSYLTNMIGMTAQNFLSAATGMAILVAFIRGLARRNSQTIGNFWVDLVRGTLYILLPLGAVAALMLVPQGAVQTLEGPKTIEVLQFKHYEEQPLRDERGQPLIDKQSHPPSDQKALITQLLAVGPAATQVISRDLGTSGGGFFNANSAHPFESPTPLSDFLLLLTQTMLAAALTYTFGIMVGDTRQGWAILVAMLLILAVFLVIGYEAESSGNPRLALLGVDHTANDHQPGGNMEGKEVRFGIARTALVAVATTATSTGAANGMHDSLLPLGGLVTLIMMQLGEVILGGVGSGLGGMLIFVILAVFMGGLMVGRTPEYLGKKLEPYDLKMAALAILIMPLVVLGFTAVAVITETGTSSMFNPGSHGFSEVLYAYTSMTNNNGSTFAGLNANTPFYNLTGGIAMFIGRFWTTLPILALAGSFARKRTVYVSEGSLPTHTPLFVFWLMVVTMAMGAMTFLPALALGPIVEHFSMRDLR